MGFYVDIFMDLQWKVVKNGCFRSRIPAKISFGSESYKQIILSFDVQCECLVQNWPYRVAAMFIESM